jgi:Holliday junction DNA helicase RuvA
VITVSGIGFEVAVPSRSLLGMRVGQQITLNTSLVVREDSLTLYGFEDTDELDTFELLLGVTGIGPRMALAILSSMTVDEVARAVVGQDDRRFTAVSGIGAKTAKMIVLSLSGKLSAQVEDSAATTKLDEEIFQDVVSALMGLGIDEKSAMLLVQQAVEQTVNPTRDALLKKALSISAAKRGDR